MYQIYDWYRPQDSPTSANTNSRAFKYSQLQIECSMSTITFEQTLEIYPDPSCSCTRCLQIYPCFGPFRCQPVPGPITDYHMIAGIAYRIDGD